MTIPKSTHRERVEQNLDVFNFVLTDEEIARIATIDTGTSMFLDRRHAALHRLPAAASEAAGSDTTRPLTGSILGV